MDFPGKGTFNVKLNAAGKNEKLTYNLLSLPLYMVTELKRFIGLGTF